VLEVRERERDEATALLAGRLAELETARIELERMLQLLANAEEDYQKAALEFNSVISNGAKTATILNHKRFAEDEKRKVTDLKHEADIHAQTVKSAEEKVRIAKKDLEESSRSMSVIEKHKKSWEKSEVRRETKDEQKLLDEFSRALHQRDKDI